jgi:hypothetical protein
MIVSPQSIVEYVCKVDEDGIERCLALDRALLLSERRGPNFMIVYFRLQLFQDL